MLNDLKQLREMFLNSSAELQRDYWTPELLAIYAQTLGERIRWKWQHFMADIVELGLHPATLFAERNFCVEDWGCGPGTAAHAYIASAASTANFTVQLTDRSPTAVRFAEARLRRDFPDVRLGHSAGGDSPPLRIRLLSYVISELSPKRIAQLSEELRTFDLFLWVDAGSTNESRALSQLRDRLMPNFDFLAPCPHQFACPVLASPQNWCHRFARAPREVFHSSAWSEIARELKIDLRSLPYHSLYAVNRRCQAPSVAPLEKRQLGRPRVARHSLQRDFCTRTGTYVTEVLTERADPQLFKKIKKRQDS